MEFNGILPILNEMELKIEIPRCPPMAKHGRVAEP